MTQVEHQYVNLRGGPLDGQSTGIGPLEFGIEIRIGTREDWDDKSIVSEHFYQVVGCHGKLGQRVLVADFVKTFTYDLPVVEAPAR